MTLGEMLQKHPERVIEHAVKGMLPNSRLGRTMYKKLKVYAGDKHPHQAQLAGVKESDKGSYWQMSTATYNRGTGRRKCAIAQVRLSSGSGNIIINGKPYQELFPLVDHRRMIEQAFVVTDTIGKV